MESAKEQEMVETKAAATTDEILNKPPELEPAPAVVTDISDLVSEPGLQALTDGLLPPPESPANASHVTDLETPEPGEMKSDKPWTCPRCPEKSYEYKSFLARHIKRSHKDEADAILASLPQTQQTPGRKPGVKNTVKPNFDDLTSKVAESAQSLDVDYKFMAEMIFNMTTGSLCGFFGPEWAPREDSPGSNTSREKDNTIECMRVYLKSREIKDIPPGLMLTFVAVAYAAPRLKAPATNEKLKVGWYWLKSKFSRKPKLKVL